jgi:hypothetical protein
LVIANGGIIYICRGIGPDFVKDGAIELGRGGKAAEKQHDYSQML